MDKKIDYLIDTVIDRYIDKDGNEFPSEKSGTDRRVQVCADKLDEMIGKVNKLEKVLLNSIRLDSQSRNQGEFLRLLSESGGKAEKRKNVIGRQVFEEPDNGVDSIVQKYIF